MACNDLFGAGQGSQIAPTNKNKYFRLDQAEMAIVNTAAERLLIDFQVLINFVQVTFLHSMVVLVFVLHTNNLSNMQTK